MEGSHWSSRVIFFFLLINLFTLCAELIHLEPFTWVTAAQWNLILTFALHCWSLRLLSLLTLHSTSSALYLHHRFETHALLRLRVHSSESYSQILYSEDAGTDRASEQLSLNLQGKLLSAKGLESKDSLSTLCFGDLPSLFAYSFVMDFLVLQYRLTLR